MIIYLANIEVYWTAYNITIDRVLFPNTLSNAMEVMDGNYSILARW